METQGLLPDPEILRWLNRVSDLLFVLARYHEAASGVRPEPSRERE
jgi:cob(I)alamin adenosyltransferase